MSIVNGVKLNQQTSLQGHGLAVIHTHPGIQSSIILQTIPSPTCGIPRKQFILGSLNHESLLIFFIFGGQGRSIDPTKTYIYI